MKNLMTFRMLWDKPGGESLMDFKAKRDKLKMHIYALQARGVLPDGPISWEVGRVSEQALLPGIDAEDQLSTTGVGLEICALPVVIHQAGCNLD
jgi:hypothetical protein